MPKDGKPRGKMSSYAFFVQTCREEHKKKHPGEAVVFAEFSKKCSEKWKAMAAKEKQRFEDMAAKDKVRYNKEMATMPAGEKGGKRKRTKDPNAPKRNLSGFFFFCNEERGKVKAAHPSYGVCDIAKEMGKKWEVCTNRAKYETLAAKDKERYEKEMAVYRAGGGGSNGSTSAAKKAKPAAKKAAAAEPEDDDEDEDEDEEDDESD